MLWAVFALALTQVRGPEDAPLVFALVFAIEAGTTCFEPARGAVIPQIVPREGLAAANALGGATWSAMLAFGAMLGGGVVVGLLPSLGWQVVFLLLAIIWLVLAKPF